MGRIFKFDKDVDTDQIIASQYLLFPTIDEMKSHTFESLDSDFASAVKPGDFVVADDNFGCGSSSCLLYTSDIWNLRKSMIEDSSADSMRKTWKIIIFP